MTFIFADSNKQMQILEKMYWGDFFIIISFIIQHNYFKYTRYDWKIEWPFNFKIGYGKTYCPKSLSKYSPSLWSHSCRHAWHWTSSGSPPLYLNQFYFLQSFWLWEEPEVSRCLVLGGLGHSLLFWKDGTSQQEGSTVFFFNLSRLPELLQCWDNCVHCVEYLEEN